MRMALDTAAMAPPRDVPVGAVLVYADELVARGWNRREIDNNPVAHAEILALQEGAERLKRWRLHGATLYVTLEPCPMCASAILQARVSRVVFGASDPIMGACGSRYGLLTNPGPAADGTVVSGGLMEEACAERLRRFFRSTRSD